MVLVGGASLCGNGDGGFSNDIQTSIGGEMNDYNLMQEVLGEHWQKLPKPLKAHYQAQDNCDVGSLSIDYPGFMQPVYFLLGLFGILIARRRGTTPTTVHKQIRNRKQIWSRQVYLSPDKEVKFNSVWVHAGAGRIIEYVNPMFGLCMSVYVMDGRLHYQGKYYVLNLGFVRLPIPEWLLLGHATIVESAVNNELFSMDFRLIHPWIGQVYRYSGVFRTVSK